MKNSIITLFLLHLVLFGYSQDIPYDVRGTYNRPIVKEKLNKAKTLSDINPGYPSSWISREFSVVLMATCNGIVMEAESPNDTLSNEQISILKMADIGTDIVVDIKYNPKNSIIDDLDIRVINFTYSVVPEIEAEYFGGYELLKQYLKENAIDKISEPIAKQIQLATVRFTINEQGQIIDALISKSSEDEKTDKILLQAIREMPKWKPAENSNGIKVKQEFIFTVGNIVGC